MPYDLSVDNADWSFEPLEGSRAVQSGKLGLPGWQIRVDKEFDPKALLVYRSSKTADTRNDSKPKLSMNLVSLAPGAKGDCATALCFWHDFSYTGPRGQRAFDELLKLMEAEHKSPTITQNAPTHAIINQMFDLDSQRRYEEESMDPSDDVEECIEQIRDSIAPVSEDTIRRVGMLLGQQNDAEFERSRNRWETARWRSTLDAVVSTDTGSQLAQEIDLHLLGNESALDWVAFALASREAPLDCSGLSADGLTAVWLGQKSG